MQMGLFFQFLFQCVNVAVVIVSALKSIMKEQLEEIENLGFLPLFYQQRTTC